MIPAGMLCLVREDVPLASNSATDLNNSTPFLTARITIPEYDHRTPLLSLFLLKKRRYSRAAGSDTSRLKNPKPLRPVQTEPATFDSKYPVCQSPPATRSVTLCSKLLNHQVYQFGSNAPL